MSDALPKFFALRSTEHGTYLRYNGDFLSFLDFDGDDVYSPLSKFELVPASANTTRTGLVNIKCCHNNKFIQQVQAYLSATADAPDESMWSMGCTLFEPQVLEAQSSGRLNKFIWLLHFLNEVPQHTTPRRIAGTLYFIRTVSASEQHIFEVIDLESLPVLPVLPKHVAFKGDNRKYLTVGSNQHLKFTSTEKAGAGSWFEITNISNGRVQIMSHFSKLYWTLSPATSTISSAEANPNASNVNARRSTFSQVQVEKNVFAFRCVDNGNFCGAEIANNDLDEGETEIANNGLDGAIFATYPTIVTETSFLMEELVLSRRIYNTDFHLLRARIYGESPVNMVTANASNNTSVENTVEFKLSYTDTKTSMWTSSESKMTSRGVSASINIPWIGSFGPQISGEYTDTYEWGETISSENTLETTYTVVVPPHSSITVSVMATKGYCDVPFSYYQEDKLYDGSYEVFLKDDGLYTGMNSYNFRYEIAETSDETSRTDHRTIYMEQKIPMPLEAKTAETRARATSVMQTQEENMSPLPLKETLEEHNVLVSLEETASEVQKLSLSPEV